jgi:hypothetical protein
MHIKKTLSYISNPKSEIKCGLSRDFKIYILRSIVSSVPFKGRNSQREEDLALCPHRWSRLSH